MSFKPDFTNHRFGNRYSRPDKTCRHTGKVVDFPGSEAIDPTQVLLLDVDVVVC
ncbi:hypothetical protein [Mobiluncus mulieris]|uniref:hypothetical protein n=1 Tax=Mobiluncus mulieris TaxID=2052 RepID=UPI0020167BDB|nr:hypothetical protein [Mobiluncus mulieris]